MLKIQSDKKSSNMRITRKKKLKIKPRLRLNIFESKKYEMCFVEDTRIL